MFYKIHHVGGILTSQYFDILYQPHILIGHYLQNIKPLTIEQTLDSGNEINARRGLHNHIQIDTQLRVFVTIVHCAFSCWKHRKNCECSPGHSLIVNY